MSFRRVLTLFITTLVIIPLILWISKRMQGTYIEIFKENLVYELLIAICLSLIDTMMSFRKFVNRSIREDGTLALIDKVTNNTLMAKAANRLINNIADLGLKDEKKKEMMCCFLSNMNDSLELLANKKWYDDKTILFELVKGRLRTMIKGDIKDHSIMINLMSLINPEDWSKRDWIDYQDSLLSAVGTYKSAGLKTYIKRIHILSKKDFEKMDIRNRLIGLMLAECLMNMRVQTIIIPPNEVSSLISNPNIGFIYNNLHLYDYGVYIGVKDRFYVLSDIDPYFIRARSSIRAFVDEDVVILDILRRNFNYAWSSGYFHGRSLYSLIASEQNITDYDLKKEKEKIISFIPRQHRWMYDNDGLFDELDEMFKNIYEYNSEKEFWDKFNVCIEEKKK